MLVTFQLSTQTFETSLLCAIESHTTIHHLDPGTPSASGPPPSLPPNAPESPQPAQTASHLKTGPSACFLRLLPPHQRSTTTSRILTDRVAAVRDRNRAVCEEGAGSAVTVLGARIAAGSVGCAVITTVDGDGAVEGAGAAAHVGLVVVGCVAG